MKKNTEKCWSIPWVCEYITMNYLTSLEEAKAEAKKSFALNNNPAIAGFHYAIKLGANILHVSINRDGDVREVNPDGSDPTNSLNY